MKLWTWIVVLEALSYARRTSVNPDSPASLTSQVLSLIVVARIIVVHPSGQYVSVGWPRSKFASRKVILYLRRMRVETLSSGLTGPAPIFCDVKVEIWNCQLRGGLIIDVHHICVHVRKTSKGEVFIVIKVVGYGVRSVSHLGR
jgi:hypothetical protein